MIPLVTAAKELNIDKQHTETYRTRALAMHTNRAITTAARPRETFEIRTQFCVADRRSEFAHPKKG